MYRPNTRRARLSMQRPFRRPSLDPLAPKNDLSESSSLTLGLEQAEDVVLTD